MIDKVVIFDWGGVCESHEDNMHDLEKAKIRVIKKFNNKLTDEEILRRWTSRNSKGVLISVLNRREDIEDWFNLFKKNMDIFVSYEEFKKTYEEELSTVKYYKELVDYAHSLKGRCKIAILSNLMPLDRKRINDQYNLGMFDFVYLSYDMGIRKPDGRVYEYVINDLKVTGKDILFIDDVSDNILMARKYGWNTCQAFGYELDKIKEAVESFLA